VLHEYAEKLVNLRADAQGALTELREVQRGKLVIAANEFTSLYLLPVLGKFRRLHPMIKIMVLRSLGSRIGDQVLRHAAEFGVLSFDPQEPLLSSVVVYSDELAFVVPPSHPLATAGEISIKQLGAETFVAHNVPSPYRDKVIDSFRKYKTPLHMDVELPTLQAIKREILIDNSAAANTQPIAIVLGSTTLNLAAGKKAFVETDGTTNGLELVISNDAAGGGGAYVAKAGDTMTGPLVVGPIVPAATWAGWFKGSSAVGNSYGIIIDAGTTNGDAAIFARNAAGTQLFAVQGDGLVTVNAATASTSPTTGALTVGGGLGVAGNINCGGTISGVTLIPQNSQSAAYTTVLADGGKHLLHPSADTTARTFTIASNASVAYPIGTAITFANQNAAGVLTIAITSDTMRLAGAGTTGSRTLAANGMATALKIASTEWIISGSGLT
jgi:hypothetical protein